MAAGPLCHRRLQEWQDQGVWERMRLKLLTALDDQAKLDWSLAFLDGSFVPGKKATVLNVKDAEHQEPRFVVV
jgi:hypothetical protein